jgi:hypothetical protein
MQQSITHFGGTLNRKKYVQWKFISTDTTTKAHYTRVSPWIILHLALLTSGRTFIGFISEIFLKIFKQWNSMKDRFCELQDEIDVNNWPKKLVFFCWNDLRIRFLSKRGIKDGIIHWHNDTLCGVFFQELLANSEKNLFLNVAHRWKLNDEKYFEFILMSNIISAIARQLCLLLK